MLPDVLLLDPAWASVRPASLAFLRCVLFELACASVRPASHVQVLLVDVNDLPMRGGVVVDLAWASLRLASHVRVLRALLVFDVVFLHLAWASLRPASRVRVLPAAVRILPLRVSVVVDLACLVFLRYNSCILSPGT